MGFLFFLTLPGLVVALVGVAFVDRVVLRRGKVSATGFEMLHANLADGKRHELEQRRSELFLRDEEGDGAPPRSRIDLDGAVARIQRTAPRGDGAPGRPAA